MKFTKKEVQERVSRLGKPLNLDKFTWCGKGRQFTSKQPNLDLNFKYIEKFKIYLSYASTVFAGHHTTITATGGLTAVVGCFSNIYCYGDWNNITVDSFSSVSIAPASIVKVLGSGVTIGFGGGKEIKVKKGDIIETCPRTSCWEYPSRYLLNGELDGVPHIIANNILSRILSKKGNVYNVINDGERWGSWLIKHKDTYARGETLEDARSCLMNNLLSIDNPKHHDLTLKSILALEKSMKDYHSIKGTCGEGQRYCVENKEVKTSLCVTMVNSLKSFFKSNK
tara:strand:+ start:49323 stop:50168 length:846 start_codon:yes stop_codon:yes gene_type:complete